ncbi:MAG: hypothetical protein QF890_07305 [Myxococcota bacterium]|jgi:hypothetical protein|nr:hypothetical protein [Deltaproteobacteria bacterium]MCP4245023.1 hypothetical protein [bacterium]MDP6075591.1 hypothetical protein [Myxococcota bacterium]MDP6242713.1 hypothetical protein [Myxococcota bacterium]MDP7074514.1 hypothetical protein [Myxococcota bacterium]|tara:strand:+ start:165 stop:482 length:318 start_codon:yes stop_codon:yes gene_type:complete
MAPRGCYVPEETPACLDIYVLNEMTEVWSENAAARYDEDHQVKTLAEVEFVAGDMPAKWLCQINHDFHEVKLFLATPGPLRHRGDAPHGLRDLAARPAERSEGDV